jgi:hypothetical protein
MDDKKTVIIIRETWPQSWMRDASSVVGFVALIGIGVYLESSAMQWVGAILGFSTLFSGLSDLESKNTLTTEEARRRLDEIDTEQSTPAKRKGRG